MIFIYIHALSSTLRMHAFFIAYEREFGQCTSNMPHMNNLYYNSTPALNKLQSVDALTQNLRNLHESKGLV